MFSPHTFLSCSSVDPPWPAASFRRKSPVWVLHRLQCLLGMSTCSSMGSSMGCSVDICFGVIFHGLQAGDLLHHGLQGGLCSGPWSTSSPPPFTSVLAPWLSHFFSLTAHCHAAFMSFIKYSFLEVQPPWLRDTAWAPAANAPVYVGFNHGIVFQTYVSYPVHLF